MPVWTIVLALLIGAAAAAGTFLPVFGNGTAYFRGAGAGWPFLFVAGLAVIGAIDLARGNPAGLGAVAGAAVAMAGMAGLLVHDVVDSHARFGPGTAAFGVGGTLGLIGLGSLSATTQARRARAPGWVGAAVGVAGIVWAVAHAVPYADGFRWGSTWESFDIGGSRVVVAIWFLVSVLVFVAAAVRRTVGSLGAALGVALFWSAMWTHSSLLDGTASTLGFAPGHFGLVGAASLTAVVVTAGGLLLLRTELDGAGSATPPGAPSPAFGAPMPPGPRLAPVRPVALVAVLGLVTALVLGVVGTTERHEWPSSGDGYTYEDADGYHDGYEDEGYDPAGDESYAPADDTTYGTTGDDTTSENDSGGAATVPVSSCPVDETRPHLERYWQDGDTIHVVVTIITTCRSPQVLADPDASFGLYAAGESFAAATFDLSRQPIAVPAEGSSGEVELVFRPQSATVNTTALAHIRLADRSAPASTGLDIRYEFRCEPDPDDTGTSSPDPVSSNGGVDLDGAEQVDYPANEADTLPSVGAVHGDDALAELRRIATSDRPFVEAALFDRWVPQLSSKTVGITDKHTGVTYGDAGDILDHYLGLRARYPDLRLVNSSTYSSFKLQDYWVIIDADAFDSAEAANAWCDAQGFDPTECYAKRINNGPYEGNTKTRE